MHAVMDSTLVLKRARGDQRTLCVLINDAKRCARRHGRFACGGRASSTHAEHNPEQRKDSEQQHAIWVEDLGKHPVLLC